MRIKNRHKPHCKECRMRMGAPDYCYSCRTHVCPRCVGKYRHDIVCRVASLPIDVK